jgi:DNA-binding winged helix-turn-helix (wHTH) protein/tetratricopeptide (TPR) repeat protein
VVQELQSFVFGPFRLDQRDARLWRDEDVLHLPPKPFAVLCCLLAQAGQLVTKDALLGTVWPETAVSESVLTAAIRHLRRVLGDHARTPRFIETVHSRGYRFTAQVVLAESVLSRPQTVEMKRPASSVARIGSPLFVGRESELVQVHRWFNTALQGTRQVGVIAGEPGIGKTALVHAFVAQVVAQEDVWVGYGQCVESYGAGEPYRPVLEALGRLGREPGGPRLVAALRRYAPSWLAQLPALLPRAEWEALQRTLGNTGPTRMLRELTEALDALTTTRPLVLVLEDLHWSDRATLEWLAYVARRPDPARLLLLGTYRPAEAVFQAHPLRTILTELRPHGQCVELALDYLSQAEVAAYLGRRFGDIRPAADLARLLHRRTTGNPLFLIALADELVRQQILRGGSAGWEVGAGVETITAMVPATLRALIELQLAHLSPEDQMLLEAASVAGVEFSTATVAAALGRADEGVEMRCTALVYQGQFLRAYGQAAWPDGTGTTGYGFRHALYQEVLYQQVPTGRQRRWHARIGTRLARGFGEQAGDMAAAVAMHLLRGRLLPQAVPYLRHAGETALARSAHREAVAYFEQALHALAHLPETDDTHKQGIDLRLALRSALQPSGDYRRILTYLREAEALAVALLNDHRRLGQVLGFLSDQAQRMGAYHQARVYAQRTLALAETGDERVLRALANLYLGNTYQYQGDYHRAIRCFREAMAALEGVPRSERFGQVNLPAVLCCAHLAWCHAELGTFAEGRRCGEEGLRIAEAAASPVSVMYAAWGIGLLALRQGDLSRALPVLERAVEICRDADLPNYLPRVASTLGAAYTLGGRLDDAVPLLEHGLEQAMALERVNFQAFCLLPLGEAKLLAGHPEEAQTLAECALMHARAHQEQGHQAYALRLLGDMAAHHAPLESGPAGDYYRQALVLATELGMRPLAAHCLLGLGTLYAKIGQREQAYAELSAAIELYRAMGMTFWLPQTEAAVASLDSPPS